MGVLLQGFFKLPPNNAVPSPADGDPSVPWWWDHLASQANELRQAGFTGVWLPPALKAASGADNRADGYAPFDDYDIGSKQQKGSIPTRFGTREQLQRCVAVMRANGLDVYLDIVEHQRLGDTEPFVFRYPGADGTANLGRFPKDPPNFVPQVPRDPNLGGPAADDIAFGRELAPINGQPPQYVSNSLVASADWLTRALGLQGYRIDDVKGLSTDFLFPFLNSQSMTGKFAVGEFFDGNLELVNNWVFNPTGMRGRVSAFDFPLRFALAAMCGNPKNFNMANLDHAGLTGTSPLNSVTFVENHDTDLEDNNKIVFNKLLAYAYILTSEGYPCVYYRDYSTDANCYGLKPLIDNLIWIHETLAAGATLQRWRDFNVLAYERLGAPNLLVGLNNDPDGAQTINVLTGFGPNTTLHDYTGHGPDTVTDGQGSVTITIPPNNNGAGYVCYSRTGFGGGFAVNSQPVTQDFDGAADLDILPCLNGQPVQAGRIWCAANSPIQAVLKADLTGWTNATTIQMELIGPDGAVRATQNFTSATPPGTPLQTTASADGFHTFRLTAANTPAANPNPAFTLSATYSSTSIFAEPLPMPDPSVVGQWSEIIAFPNVAIHTNVLPTGKVLFWGRRVNPTDSVDVQACEPFLWDPATQTSTPTGNRPTLADGTAINIFCSGHTFLPDGRLLVVGGHIVDSNGINQACLFDPLQNTWSPTALMNEGRWYPTAITLPDGSVLVSSGSLFAGNGQIVLNDVQQVWENGVWNSIVNFIGLPLFPRMHIAPDGRVFMCGGNAQSFFLDPRNGGTWTPGPFRTAGNRDYAPSVMYDVGKIIFIGGGLETDTLAPTNIVEIIDLTAPAPVWNQTSPLRFPRRQHNATLLPDGTVLVTGGTQGNGFNNLDPGQPVHTAELWDPATGNWTVLAAESVDRCYHATAVLLPDATVLSAGSGEFRPTPTTENDPKDSHRDGQIFSPPYLFKGARPVITSAPASVLYGQAFSVGTAEPDEIGQISWIRLPSVTHSFDQNQRINFLPFQINGNTLSITAPGNANLCPPGHYMLFLLNKSKVPSIAQIIQIAAAPSAPIAQPAAVPRPRSLTLPTISTDLAIQATALRRPVEVGVTAACPYGISACWGGAYQALSGLEDVDVVRPIPNADDSTAYLYLKDDGLPPVNKWPAQFARTANGTHLLRGVEVTLDGLVEAHGNALTLSGSDTRPPVVLTPLQAENKIQWDHQTGTRKPMQPEEQAAFADLKEQVEHAGGALKAVVTGPLLMTGNVMQVRKFTAQNEQKV
jgi:galactose oxidase